MKLWLLASALLLPLLLGLGGPAAGDAAKKARHAASGEGTSLVNGVDLPFAFEAAARSKKKADGRARFDLPGLGTLEGEVDCLDVEGNRATLSGKLDRPVDGYYTHFAVVAADNGPAEQPAADTYWPFISHAPIPCGNFLEAPSRAPITSGDIRVR